jgi:hypothetical protein
MTPPENFKFPIPWHRQLSGKPKIPVACGALTFSTVLPTPMLLALGASPGAPGAGRIVELRFRCPGLARLNAIARVPCPGQQVLRR